MRLEYFISQKQHYTTRSSTAKKPAKNTGGYNKTKLLATKRDSAAQEDGIRFWFVDYRQVLRALRISNKMNIVNFDEAGFRVGCMKRHEILVPADVSEV